MPFIVRVCGEERVVNRECGLGEVAVLSPCFANKTLIRI